MQISTSQFAMYGLNRYRNFLGRSGADGGHRERDDFAVKDRGALRAVCASLILACDDNLDTAVFVIHHDGTQEIIMRLVYEDDDMEDIEDLGGSDEIKNEDRGEKPFEKDEDGGRFAVIEIKEADHHAFAKLDAEWLLDRYALLIEIEEGVYHIAE